MCFSSFYRTISNISDENSCESDVITLEGECDADVTCQPNSKRRRSTESTFDRLVQSYEKNSTERIKILQQRQNEPLTELGHFFSSICKTVERFTPYEQAHVKIEISNLIGRIELDRFRNVMPPNSYPINNYQQNPAASSYNVPPQTNAGSNASHHNQWVHQNTNPNTGSSNIPHSTQWAPSNTNPNQYGSVLSQQDSVLVGPLSTRQNQWTEVNTVHDNKKTYNAQNTETYSLTTL